MVSAHLRLLTRWSETCNETVSLKAFSLSLVFFPFFSIFIPQKKIVSDISSFVQAVRTESMNPSLTRDLLNLYSDDYFFLLTLLGALFSDHWLCVVSKYLGSNQLYYWCITLEMVELFDCRWHHVWRRYLLKNGLYNGSTIGEKKILNAQVTVPEKSDSCMKSPIWIFIVSDIWNIYGTTFKAQKSVMGLHFNSDWEQITFTLISIRLRRCISK